MRTSGLYLHLMRIIVQLKNNWPESQWEENSSRCTLFRFYLLPNSISKFNWLRDCVLDTLATNHEPHTQSHARVCNSQIHLSLIRKLFVSVAVFISSIFFVNILIIFFFLFQFCRNDVSMLRAIIRMGREEREYEMNLIRSDIIMLNKFQKI